MNAILKTLDAITETPVTTDRGVVIPGKPDLFIPGATLREIDKIGEDMRAEEEAARAAGKIECANPDCGEWFMPRKGSGGKPQRFCSSTCKAAGDGGLSKPVPNVAVKSPTLAAPGPNVGKSDSDFDWHENDSVVLREQPETAIYFNAYGQLVIRQREDWPHENGDPYVVISENNISDFLDKITAICGIPSVGKPHR